MKTVFLTGAAGFIGCHVAKWLLDHGWHVVGYDNVNAYYDPALKRARLALHEGREGWRFTEGDLCDAKLLAKSIAEVPHCVVVHLAAQAGVRWSISHPDAYVQSNLVGFANVLECCRNIRVKHLVYASSSSVYGANAKLPFAESDNVDHPVSLYAATKKANELMAHSYSHLFGVPTTGLRFFTVYGPWGRPDMAYWRFTEAILAGQPIDVFAGGLLKRDFTFIDDVVEAMGRLLEHPPTANNLSAATCTAPSTSVAPWRIYNVGNHSPVSVNDMIDILEQLCERKALRVEKPMQPGDVETTYADIGLLTREFSFHPNTPLHIGLQRFVEWFRAWSSSRHSA